MLQERTVLDFLATVAERGTTDFEYLRRPEDLAAWAVEARVLSGPVRVTPGDLAGAVALREAMYRLLDAALDRVSPSPEDRDLVNAAARRALPVRQLTGSGVVLRTGTVGAVLALLAADCLELYDSPDLQLLSRCDDPRCTRLYLDRSRGGRRRWCDMKGCGDRAKAAAYRRRHQGTATTTAPRSR
jgi:predicted RNA-binding Zn ribbon-like protein